MENAFSRLHTSVSAAEKFREVYWGFTPVIKTIWYVTVIVTIAIFLYGLWVLYREYRRGRQADSLPLSRLPGRLLPTLAEVYSHRRIGRRDPVAKWAHRGILYGFTVLFIGTVLVAIDTDITVPIFDVSFLQGDFYLFFKFSLNVAGVLFLAGLATMIWRRGVRKPPKLSYESESPAVLVPPSRARLYEAGDWTFLISLFLIGVTGFALQGVRLAMDSPGYEWAQFGGVPFAALFGLTLSDIGVEQMRYVLWWVHAILALVFVASIPYTKASHMFTGVVNLALIGASPRSASDPASGAETPPPVLEPSPVDVSAPGYRVVTDMSRIHLLQVDACTKCGKCHEACPARATGRPLSPRNIVLDLREQARTELRPRRRDDGQDTLPDLVGLGSITEDAIWSCTQCNACVEICPVGIEQAPMINLLRQSQVDRGELPGELQDTFETIRAVGNSFGVETQTRGNWTKLAPELSITDARERPVDVLWFVGDHASFDPQAQRVAVSLARVMSAAGVEFGILFDGERNSGNDVRAAGELGLFQELLEHNVETISKCTFNRIMTSDPHSFNALRKAYPESGVNWTVLHHTQLILELINDGRLDVEGAIPRRVTYHDPCFLGRHNGVYDPPREILARLGCELIEMPRNRDNSFCCGAGGGRIWMKDPVGKERPSDNRIREAAELDVDLYVVSCPKDVIMYEAAIRDTGNSENLALRELTQLVEEALHAKRRQQSTATLER